MGTLNGYLNVNNISSLKNQISKYKLFVLHGATVYNDQPYTWTYSGTATQAIQLLETYDFWFGAITAAESDLPDKWDFESSDFQISNISINQVANTGSFDIIVSDADIGTALIGNRLELYLKTVNYKIETAASANTLNYSSGSYEWDEFSSNFTEMMNYGLESAHETEWAILPVGHAVPDDTTMWHTTWSGIEWEDEQSGYTLTISSSSTAWSELQKFDGDPLVFYIRNDYITGYARLATKDTWNDKNTAVSVPLSSNTLSKTVNINDTYHIRLRDLDGYYETADDYIGIDEDTILNFTVAVPSSVTKSATVTSGTVATPDITITAKQGSLSATDPSTYVGLQNGITFKIQSGSLAYAIDGDNLTASYNNHVYTLTGNGIGSLVGTSGWVDSGDNPSTETITISEAVVSATPTISSNQAQFKTESNGAGYLGNNTIAVTVNCYTGALEE